VGEGEKMEEREGIWKVAFWNVAGLVNKDKDFWRGIKEWDVVTLSETWVDEKGWSRVRGKLPRGYEWGVQFATRRSKKVRDSYRRDANGDQEGHLGKEDKDRDGERGHDGRTDKAGQGKMESDGGLCGRGDREDVEWAGGMDRRERRGSS